MRTRKRPGQTLVEVCMATIVMAMTTTAVFSVMLSSFTSQVKADKREAAAMVLKRAQETLKSYVSADPLNASMFTTGPAMPGSPNGGVWASDTSGNWALQSGVPHNITSLLTGTPLFGGTFLYTVSNVDCINSPGEYNQCKTVQFTLTYPD